MIYDEGLYVFTSHDEDVTVNNFFTMNDWRLYSTVERKSRTRSGRSRETGHVGAARVTLS